MSANLVYVGTADMQRPVRLTPFGNEHLALQLVGVAEKHVGERG